MDPGSTVDEHGEKWTSTASARAPQKRDNTTDPAGVENDFLQLPLFKESNNYETDNLHILKTDLKE